MACKTDRIDAWVLAELARRELVPAIWLPTPEVRAERERARWRLHLVRHRVALKNRVHATLLAFGRPCPTSDLFGSGGRQLLDRLRLPEPWAGTTAAAVALIDDNTSYSKDITTRTADVLKGDASVKVVNQQSVTAGESDYSAAVTAILRAAPDFVYWTGYYQEGGLLIKQLRGAGYSVDYTEFDGVHEVPSDISSAAFDWLLADYSEK